MDKPRTVKADELIPDNAGGSLMDRLRRRRIAIEDGDPTGGDAFNPAPQPEQKKRAGGRVKARGVGVAKRGHGKAGR